MKNLKEIKRYDSDGNLIYIENENGWVKREYDSEGNLTYYITDDDKWGKKEWDADQNIIYWETSSDGVIIDNRIK